MIIFIEGVIIVNAVGIAVVTVVTVVTIVTYMAMVDVRCVVVVSGGVGFVIEGVVGRKKSSRLIGVSVGYKIVL